MRLLLQVNIFSFNERKQVTTMEISIRQWKWVSQRLGRTFAVVASHIFQITSEMGSKLKVNPTKAESSFNKKSAHLAIPTGDRIFKCGQSASANSKGRRCANWICFDNNCSKTLRIPVWSLHFQMSTLLAAPTGGCVQVWPETSVFWQTSVLTNVSVL